MTVVIFSVALRYLEPFHVVTKKYSLLNGRMGGLCMQQGLHNTAPKITQRNSYFSVVFISQTKTEVPYPLRILMLALTAQHSHHISHLNYDKLVGRACVVCAAGTRFTSAKQKLFSELFFIFIFFFRIFFCVFLSVTYRTCTNLPIKNMGKIKN